MVRPGVLRRAVVGLLIAGVTSVTWASAVPSASASTGRPGAATAGTEPVVQVASRRSVRTLDPVRVTISRLTADPVVIAWGDGTRTRAGTACQRPTAIRHPHRCSVTVAHAYRAPGRFTVIASHARRTAYRTVITVAAAGTSSSTQDSTADDWEQRMLDSVNALRSAAGVAPVRLCARLEASAGDYAGLMARTNHYGHVGPDGSSPWDRMAAKGYAWHAAAENIAAGFPDVSSVMAAWRASPGHYENIVNPEFEHVGFGRATAPGSQYGTYWVQHFGAGGSCS